MTGVDVAPAPATTALPVTPAAAPDVPRVIGGVRGNEAFPVLGALAGAVGFTTLLFHYFAPFTGRLGFVVVACVAFVGLYATLAALDDRGPAVRARIVAVIIHGLAFVLVGALLFVIVYTLIRGWSAYRRWNFYLQDMALAGPLEPLTVGGVTHAMVGTLEQILICLAITVPVGVVCAVFLSELPGRFSTFVRTIVEAMTALPSIVAGLFVYLSIILILGFDKSGFAASLALSIMTLPIIVRAADVVLRLVPGTLREASLALGASQWRTVWHVVLPTARSGLTTSVILGTARGIGETSPVLLTAGFATGLNWNPFAGPQISLPLFTFDSSQSPEPAMEARAFGGAAALMVLVVALFVIARLVAGRDAGRLSAGQWRRRMRASQRDLIRFTRREDGHG